MTYNALFRWFDHLEQEIERHQAAPRIQITTKCGKLILPAKDGLE